MKVRPWLVLAKNFMQDGVTRIRLLSLDTQANVFFKASLIVKLWHTMCFTENSNEGFKRFDNVVFQDHMANYNHFISTSTVPLPTSLGTMVTLTIQKVLLTKQYDLLITWFCEIMGQTQTIFSPYYDFRWGTFAHRSHDHLIMQSSKSQKLKPLYLHYQIVVAVWWLTLRGSYSCSHKALSIITWIYYITQQTKNRSLLPQYLWSPNLAWWWHGVRRLKLHEPSIRWCCEATWKKFIFPLA